MCGRMSCCCAPDLYRKALSHFDPVRKEFVELEWRDLPGHSFAPNDTILPGDIVPVLIPSRESQDEPPVLQTMIWGFQPNWGDLKAQEDGKNFSTYNCRIEGVRESKLYAPSLKAGRRCVVFCEGYYEGAPGRKQVFIHDMDNDEFSVQQSAYWEMDYVWHQKDGWKGPRLIKMAGLYNVRKQGNEEIYSFTIITRESVGQLATVHHRMPAVLTNDDELKDWLDFGHVSSNSAVENLTKTTKFNVNIKKISSASKKTPKKDLPVQKNTLMNWVIRKKDA